MPSASSRSSESSHAFNFARGGLLVWLRPVAEAMAPPKFERVEGRHLEPGALGDSRGEVR